MASEEIAIEFLMEHTVSEPLHISFLHSYVNQPEV